MSNKVAIYQTDPEEGGYPCSKQQVGNAFRLLGWDEDNYGKETWNPLGDFISKGNTVLIKPNLVLHYNQNPHGEMDCLITNISVVKAVLDYVIIALKNDGRIVIGDAPIQACDFEKLVKENGYLKLVESYKEKLKATNISLALVDFRELRSKVVNTVIQPEVGRYKYSGDGGIVVDLGLDSEFGELSETDFNNIRITDYDPTILRTHHNRYVNEYKIAKELLDADVVINMPKPKTHQFAGCTISMKNLVGVNCRKEYLPHHTCGAKSQGGDAYIRRSFLKEFNRKNLDIRNYLTQTKHHYKLAWLLNQINRCIGVVIRKFYKDKAQFGNWYGNDTISKTITDLNRILIYSDKDGKMYDTPQRKEIIVADMIVCGQGKGPMAPEGKKCNMISVGDNPVIFDWAISYLMGMKIDCNHTLRRGRKNNRFPLVSKGEEPIIYSNIPKYNKKLSEIGKKDLLNFLPPPGWENAFVYKK